MVSGFGWVQPYLIMADIKDIDAKMKTLANEFGQEYFELFGDAILIKGMDIETAVYCCWNELKCK